ncbi:MAG: autotransporter-associated beta strand repeat-containing protein [Luteolibacter sp.]
MRPNKTLLFASVAVIELLSPQIQGANIYWDGGTADIATNGDGQSQGGSGTWNITTKNWDPGSGSAHVASSKTTYAAIFGGTAGTVTVGVNLTTTGMTFNTDGYTVAGSSTLLTVKSGGIVANGNTTISALLKLSVNQSWTTASGKSLTVSGTVDTNTRILTLTGAGNTSISGVISGTGRLIKSGTGLLTLTGANTYSGTTTLSGGTLNLGIANVAGTSGPLGKSTAAASILFTGGTLQYSSLNTADYSSRFSIAGSQAWNIDTNGVNVTYATALAGASSLAKWGTGTLTVSAANSFTGGTTINTGTLNVTGTLADTGAVTVSGGTYTLGASDTIGALTLANGTVDGSGTLTASSYAVQNGTIGNSLAGSGAMTKSTTGTVTLSGASSFTGGTTISAGTLNVTGTLADTGAVTVNGGTYTVGATDSIGALTLSNGTINGPGTLTGTSYAAQTGTINTNLAGSGIALTKSTTGPVTLSGANTYTGATAINAGTLVVNGSLASGSAVSLASGATLTGTGTVGGTVTVANASAATIIAGNGTSGTLTLGNLVLSGAGTIRIGTLSNYTSISALNVTGTLTLNGAAGAVSLALPAGTLSEGTYHLIGSSLTNLTGFTVTGATLGARQLSQLVNNAGKIDYIITGANPYWTGALGSEWSTATLAAPKNWALAASQTTDFITNDAILFDDRATSTTVNIAANVSPNVVSFANSTKNYTLQGTAGIATGALTKSGTGSLTITNANSYSGGTTLNDGTLRIGNNSALGTGSIALNGGTISSDSTTARTLSNSLTIGANIVLGDATNTGALTFSGSANLGAAVRQLTTASDVTMSGVISNGGLIKSGTGTLTLSGTNTYTGGTTLNAGTIAVNSAAGLGDSSSALTFAGNSSLLFKAAFTAARNYSINTGVTATVNTNGFDITQTAIVSGAGALTKTGAGTLTISGVNTYTGDTTISSGTLALSGGSAIVDGGAVTLANVSGTTLLLNTSETIGALSGGGASGGLVNLLANTLTVGNAANTTYAGIINGTGALVKSGTGTLTLSGTNTFSGTTTVNAGTLKISADSGLGTAPVSPTAGKLVLGGGTLATTTTFTLDSNRGITTGGTIDVAAGTTLAYGGIAAGTGSLTKNGAGTLVLSGVNSYTGATEVNAGNLAVNGSLNSASAVTVAGGAILSGTGTISGSVTAEDDGILMAGNGINGILTISGSLTFNGDALIQIGTLASYLSTVNSAGALKVAGNLNFSVGDAHSILLSLPPGLVTNGTYHLIGKGNNLNGTQTGYFSVTGLTLGSRQSGTLTETNNFIDYVVAGDTPSWTGAASGAWDTSASNWKLITAGTTTTFQANDAVLFNDNATGTTTVNIAADVNPTVASFDNSTKSYVLQGTAGIASGSLTKSGTGTLTITNANTYNDATTLSAGTIQVGNNNALGTGVVALNGGTLSSDSTTPRTLANSITFGGDVTLGNGTQTGALALSGSVDLGDATRQITTSSNLTLSGSIGNGGLTKTGSGTLTLSGTNSYTGPTSVTAGKLVVNGSLANTTTTVGSGATLAGTGTVDGATTVQSGGIHSAGNGTGSQSFTDLTYADGSIFSWEIDRTLTQTRGVGYDAVNVSGTLAGLDGIDLNTTTDAIFRIVIGDNNFSNSFWSTPKIWSDIFTGLDGIAAKTNWAAIFGGGFQFYNTSGGAISAPSAGGFTVSGNTLSWSGVPEPSSVLAGLLLGAGLVRRRRN